MATIAMQSAKQLINLGHDVSILTPNNGDATYNVGAVTGIHSPQRADIASLPRKIAALQDRINGWDWPYYRYYRNAFASALKAMKPAPEVVICFNDLVSPEYIKRVLPNTKTVVWLQNEQGTRRKDLEKSLGAIDHFLTCSQYIKDYTAKRYSLDASRLSVVYSGVDLDAFTPEADYLQYKDSLRTLFIGRIDPNKGPDIAADAVAALQKEGVPITFTVAGGLWFYGHGNEMENPYFRTLKEKMDAATATYAGYVTRPNVPGVVRQHDVAFVLSRSNEPFGLVTLEAMASGCAVISSNRGGLPEACGGAAILVDPDDTAGVIRALRTLATDRDVLVDWKLKATARAATAGWQTVGVKLETVLKHVAA